MAVDHNNPQSRNEEILIATIDGTEYDKLPQSRIEELLLELKETIEEGGGGTTNYNNLSNQPQVNGETLIGDKTGADLGLVDAEDGKGLSTNDYDDTEKAAVAAATSAIAAIKDGSELDSFGDVEVALLDKADTSDLGTAAAKNSTNAVTSGSTDLVESGAVKDAIDSAVSRAYHHAGTKTVAQLTHDLLVAANEGNVYEMTDSGTTTSDFMEGIGKPIKEGDNVGVARVSEGVYKFDLLSGFVDTTNFVQKSQTAGLLKNDGTVNDEIEGDIDSLKSGFTTLDNEVNGDATVYPYADVITIPDAIPANLADCSVKIEPVQDLHGYDHPWVGGAGKNKLPLVLAEIKSLNTYGTWSENVYTENSVKYTVLLDNDGNVIGVNIDGVASTATGIILAANQTFDTDCLLSKGGSSGVGVVSLALLNNAGTEVAVEATSTGATVEAGNYGNVRISVNANITVSNVYIYPMIRLSTETDATFAPYTNYCPITGHTEASVQRDGVNLFPSTMTWELGSYGTAGNKINASDRARTVSGIKVLPNTRYTISFNSQHNFTRLCQYDSNGVCINVSYNVTFTTLSNCASITITVGTTNDNIDVKCQLELGSTATPYVPYAGKTYTIALGDTIYGGTVDFDSGKLTVDRVSVDMGTLPWGADGQNMFRANITGAKTYSRNILPPWKCEVYPTKAQDDISGQCISSTNWTSAVCLWNSGYSDAASVVTALSGKSLVYELATPLTIQLTPQQIQLLKGQNTLTASTGQISVTVNGVSGAIGSLTSDKQDKTDYALNTTAKTVVGGINELKNRVKVIEVTTSDTVDQGTTVQVPTGYDAAKAIIAGYTAQRTNNLWYNADDHVVVGMYSEYLYVVPKNVDVLEQTVKVVLIKFSA